MTVPASTPEMTEIPAGDFLDWLQHFRASLLGNQGSDVPCGDCRGCCISGYSVQIRPHDAGARALIPAELLARVQGFARDELPPAGGPDGTCPMLRDNECSIYESRPQTCRDYDCRVFAASEVSVDEQAQPEIADRVKAWVFDYESEASSEEHAILKEAAAFLQKNRDLFPQGTLPSYPV